MDAIHLANQHGRECRDQARRLGLDEHPAHEIVHDLESTLGIPQASRARAFIGRTPALVSR